MSLRNKVTLIGRTGKEVETFTFENGNVKASVSMATSDFYTNAQNEKVEETQWHNLIAVAVPPMASPPLVQQIHKSIGVFRSNPNT